MPTVLQKGGQIDLGSDICWCGEILKAQLYLPMVYFLSHPHTSPPQLAPWLSRKGSLAEFGKTKESPTRIVALPFKCIQLPQTITWCTSVAAIKTHIKMARM